ncbi:MAG TPA: peptidoglycan endopeptidase [Sphingomicrobium sp.]|nr:peptidoglycan endopeptidase [Sphingomicrobium sp.]
MTKGEQAVARARALLRTRFVAQGRDPAIGLDCVGLALLAYAIDPAGVRDDYRLSGAHRSAILRFAEPRFRRVSRRRLRQGDLLLLRPGASQWHLGIWSGGGLIHADIASGRVVERPGAIAWPVAAALRQRVRFKQGN